MPFMLKHIMLEHIYARIRFTNSYSKVIAEPCEHGYMPYASLTREDAEETRRVLEDKELWKVVEVKPVEEQ